MSAEALTKTEYGEVFTRQWVVETMLDLIVYTPDRGLTPDSSHFLGSGVLMGIIRGMA